MSKRSKKQKYRLDSKKFEAEPGKKKKEKDWGGSDIFNEIRRSKPHRR